MDSAAFLGYSFRDPALLDAALTTPSFRMDYPKATDNQRLEFLGDAVLDMLAAELLFARFPAEAEGPLTVRRTQMVSSTALCKVAGRIGLAKLLKRNRAAGELSPTAKTLADAIEAVIGAAYLDGGLDAARAIFTALRLSDNAEDQEGVGNPKGELQMRAQAMKPPQHPVYELLKTAGKAHEPVFTVKVSVPSMGESVASARSHKEAEALAAAGLLAQLGIR